MADPTLQREMARLFPEWTSDLSPAWKTFFAGTAPAPADIDASLVLDAGRFVFPGSRQFRPAGAPAGSHALRPFESIAPSSVRVVVIGQDPYFEVSQATGRSFEQGDLADWTAKRPTTSIRRLVQAVANFRAPARTDYLIEKGGWVAVSKDAAALGLEAPGALWDRWQAKGVVFVNAAFTISSRDATLPPKVEADRQKRFRSLGHARFWRPVMTRLLLRLAERPGVPLVVVTWGGDAKKTLRDVGLEAAAGPRWGRDIRQVVREHPSNISSTKGATRVPFLDGSNPLVDVNDALSAAGAAPIGW